MLLTICWKNTKRQTVSRVLRSFYKRCVFIHLTDTLPIHDSLSNKSKCYLLRGVCQASWGSLLALQCVCSWSDVGYTYIFLFVAQKELHFLLFQVLELFLQFRQKGRNSLWCFGHSHIQNKTGVCRKAQQICFLQQKSAITGSFCSVQNGLTHKTVKVSLTFIIESDRTFCRSSTNSSSIAVFSSLHLQHMNWSWVQIFKVCLFAFMFPQKEECGNGFWITLHISLPQLPGIESDFHPLPCLWISGKFHARKVVRILQGHFAFSFFCLLGKYEQRDLHCSKVKFQATVSWCIIDYNDWFWAHYLFKAFHEIFRKPNCRTRNRDSDRLSNDNQQKKPHRKPGTHDSPNSSTVNSKIVFSSLRFLLKSIHKSLILFLISLIFSCFSVSKCKPVVEVCKIRQTIHVGHSWEVIFGRYSLNRRTIAPPKLDQLLKVSFGFSLNTVSQKLLQRQQVVKDILSHAEIKNKTLDKICPQMEAAQTEKEPVIYFLPHFHVKLRQHLVCCNTCVAQFFVRWHMLSEVQEIPLCSVVRVIRGQRLQEMSVIVKSVLVHRETVWAKNATAQFIIPSGHCQN